MREEPLRGARVGPEFYSGPSGARVIWKRALLKHDTGSCRQFPSDLASHLELVLGRSFARSNDPAALRAGATCNLTLAGRRNNFRRALIGASVVWPVPSGGSAGINWPALQTGPAEVLVCGAELAS